MEGHTRFRGANARRPKASDAQTHPEAIVMTVLSRSSLARDARDAFGAAALTLASFGAPLVLALMALDHSPTVEVRVQDSGERSAVFALVLPSDEASQPDPSTGRIDGIEATLEPLPPPPPPPAPEPEPEPSAEALAEASPAEEAAPGESVDALALAAAEGPFLGRRPALDPSRVRVALPPRGSGAKSTAAKAPRKKRCEEPSEHIRMVDEGTFEIARSLVDLYVGDLEKAQSLAYVAWHRDEEGKIDGFRIRRIKCGNVLDQAGFRNGDVVHSVNGKKIRTVFGAIAAYRRLKNKEHLKVDVTSEQGEGRQMKYRIS
jgi:hypothetical protein